MATLVADRVKETTSTTGTGTVNLNGAYIGFQSFAQAFTTGAVVYYGMTDGINWEVGSGTFTSGAPNTLSRTTVLASSNAGALVNFPGPLTDVFCTNPASLINSIGAGGGGGAAGRLGYAQSTSIFSLTSTLAPVTGLSTTITVATGQYVKLTAYSAVMTSSIAAVGYLQLMEGATMLNFSQMTTNTNGVVAIAQTVLQPTAGSHTYSVSAYLSSGTGSLYGGATFPMFLLAEGI